MELPRQLGPFVLTRKIGAGGMGVVYQGTANGKPVAVKVVRSELCDDPVFLARFRREIILMRRVAGVCTAKVIAADPDAVPPYLVTEYLAGPSLEEYVEMHGPLSGAALNILAIGLAEALVAIHSTGVIHRDLKPANVLLTRDGPKVVDFGIARMADSPALTRAGIAVGTAAYMAPEQVRGTECGPAVDVFTWAATVVFAATTRPPFGEHPTSQVLHRIVHDDPDLAGAADGLLDLLGDALAKDPGQRPDAQEVLRRALALGAGHAQGADGDPAALTARLIEDAWPIRPELPDAGRPPAGIPADTSPPGAGLRVWEGRSDSWRRRATLCVVIAVIVATAALAVAVLASRQSGDGRTGAAVPAGAAGVHRAGGDPLDHRVQFANKTDFEVESFLVRSGRPGPW
jgi:serine/threonine protein kinase